nr:hypothetical protein REQ54_04217 [Rhizobium sp. Q54]
MKHIFALTALAIITLATSGQTLAREGEYYEGAFDRHTAVNRIDRNYTGSISAAPVNIHAQRQKVGSGDYYKGIQRPN